MLAMFIGIVIIIGCFATMGLIGFVILKIAQKFNIIPIISDFEDSMSDYLCIGFITYCMIFLAFLFIMLGYYIGTTVLSLK